MSKQYAHLHAMAKTSVKFQNDWPKIVGGVALTSQLLTNGQTNGRTDGSRHAYIAILHLRANAGATTKGDNSQSKEGTAVILVRNTLSCPILQFYKVPSRCSEGYSSYRADEKSISNKTKGDNSKCKKARVVILVLDTSPGPILHFYQVS